MRGEDYFNLAICAILSIFGGLGRLLSTKSKKPVKLSEMGRNALVSLSIGLGIFMLTYAVVPAAKDNSYLVFAAGYLAGWAGPWLVNGIIDKFANEKGIKKDGDK